MNPRLLKIARRLALLVFLSLLGGLLSATLVRVAPGYGVDERELGSGLSQASIEAIRSERRLDSSLVRFYGGYLYRALHGDFGNSQWLQRPVGDLVKERFPTTARSVLLGLLVAWSVAGCVALLAVAFPVRLIGLLTNLLTSSLIALPSAVVAMLALYARAPAFMAIAVVLFPKLFRYIRNLLAHALRQPFVLAAQARGIGQARILFCHAIPLAAPALCALLGVSVSLAFGSAIPIEALSDSPGIGQLAWQAALNRDLPLIVNLTLIITLVTVAANSLANIANERVT